jgi:hypothetical protein
MQTLTTPSVGPVSLERLVRERFTLFTVLAMLLAVALLWPYRHFAGDDAYITFRFVHNFAGGNGFSFNPGEPTYGSTAPLWVFMLAALNRAGLEIAAGAHLLNWIFTLLNAALFFRLACRYLGRNGAAVVATVLFLADPWFIRWSLSGMENAFALTLLIGLLLSQAHWRNSGRINWVAPVCGALAALCRPEMSLLGGFLLLDTVLFERRRMLANLVVLAVAYVAIVTPWVLYAIHVFHSPIPNTITAKISRDHLTSVLRVAQYFVTFWGLQALALVAVLVSKELRERAASLFAHPASIWFLPAAWAATLPAFYIAGGAPVAGRYMMFGLPCYLLLGVAAWAVLWGRFPKLVGAAVAVTLVLVGFVQYRYCWYITRWPLGMDPQLIDAALTLKQVSQSGDLVAADQIGVLGYYSERPVLDIFGLISPEILPYRKFPDMGPVWRYVHERKAQYLLLTNTVDDLSQWDPAYRSITLVKRVAVQREGAGAADIPPTVYNLYRTNWPR